MRVLIADELAPVGVDLLREHHAVDVRTGLPHDELIAAIGEYEAIVVRSRTTVDAAVIAAADRLTVIGRAGVGIDNIDVEAATGRGILVCNVPQSNIVSAAEHAIALMLAAARQIPRADASVRAGRWERSRFAGTELADKMLGIVGLGRVGHLVAERCRAFGMEVTAYDPYVSPDHASRLGVSLVDDLDDLCRRADVITVHLPRTEETEGIIDAERLRVMKPTALVVNAARGGLVDEAALAQALREGWIAGAALDVYASEPPGDSPLFGLDTIVLTPHLGASTGEAQDRASRMVAEAVIDALAGELVAGAVNIPVAVALPAHLAPFLGLARRLGRLCNALRASGPGEVTVELVGAVAQEPRQTEPLALAVLVGLLDDVVDRPVSYVNATEVGEARGIRVSTLVSPSRDRGPVIRVHAGEISVAGTLTDPGNRERLTEVWGYDLDVEPAEHMVFFRYVDRPGVIGRIGQMFGTAGVNIASMQVSRRQAGGDALMAMAVDSSVPPDVVAAAAEAIGASEVRTLPPSRGRG